MQRAVEKVAERHPSCPERPPRSANSTSAGRTFLAVESLEEKLHDFSEVVGVRKELHRQKKTDLFNGSAFRMQFLDRFA